ncbi:DsbA family oxidoreductase [Paracoccus pacificus]|uniref:DsbA family oxidoreductase n=1 Tax=Paracoccus pacificus TaxID=1463598 RepID=A0ABW4R439_9RHOB
MSEPQTLDIFADPICPWSMLGKANLDRALESRPDHPFVLAWHPFRLNPQTPRGGYDRAAYMQAKYGNDAARMDAQVMDAAARAGVDVDLLAIRRVPDTTDAHRLLHWAGVEGVQTPVMSALMRGYWREGRDIGDPEVLAALAASAGMDPAMVRRLLASDADLDTIAAREAHARERGVNSVPTYIIAGRHAVSGAQPVALWQNVIDELNQQPPAGAEPSS